MPRKAHNPPIVCQHFSWKIFTRGGVYYADGRSGSINLGKHSLGTKDANETLVKLRKLDLRMAVDHGLAAPATADTTANLSLEDGWDRFLTHCQRAEVMGGVSPRTFKRYRTVRDKHLEFCRNHAIAEWCNVSKKSVEDYGHWLVHRKYSPRSIYLELTVLKGVVIWLIGEKLLLPGSEIKLELSKPQGTDTYCYSKEQVTAMVELCRAQPSLAWLGDVIVALSCTGLRIGELASLRWTDLDLQARAIRLTDERASKRRRVLGTARRTKGRRNRTVPIHPALHEILVSMKRHPDGRIFHGPRGGLLKPDTVRVVFVDKVITPLTKEFRTPDGEIGFMHGRIHSFRHYFCSQAFSGGAAEADIRDWLGHSDSKITAHYRHLSAADSQRKMNQIDFLGQDARTVRVSG